MGGSEAMAVQVLPRLIRLREAPAYLGMDRNKFNQLVRPFVTEVPLGKQAIAFDRLDLDAWAGDYLRRKGRPGRSKGDTIWDVRKRRVSQSAAAFGTSINASADNAFARALEALASPRRNASSRG